MKAIGKAKFRCGKYAGKRGTDVPQWYLDWCLKNFYPKQLEYRIAEAVTKCRAHVIPVNEFDYDERRAWFEDFHAREGHKELDAALDLAIREDEPARSIKETRRLRLRGCMRNSEWNTKRVSIWEDTGGHCWYCGTSCGDAMTIDHIVPVFYGGGDELSNLRAACRRCNSAKRHSSVERFRQIFANRQWFRSPSTQSHDNFWGEDAAWGEDA